MRSSSMSSVVQPQSVPSRVSVVLVEETEVRGAECLVSGLADEVVRWSAGATSLSSGTKCMTGALRPGAVGTLSPYMYNPVGPCGTLSPSDSDSVGPVGPYGTLSPSDSDSVGPYGTLSLSDPDPVGPVGPCGTLSVSDSDSVGARWRRRHSLNSDLSDAIGMRSCASLVGRWVIVRLVV